MGKAFCFVFLAILASSNVSQARIYLTRRAPAIINLEANSPLYFKTSCLASDDRKLVDNLMLHLPWTLSDVILRYGLMNET